MDTVDKIKRSEVMRAVKSRDTKPEMVVRRLLHKAGYRYRLHRKDLPGKPDIVFPSKRKAVFVHGCFWHQHPGCRQSARPTSNTDYWKPKLDGNMVRDAKNIYAIEAQNWRTLTVWECETGDQEELLRRLKEFLDGISAGSETP
jgi:DNA mismatch endonuclease Vsr